VIDFKYRARFPDPRDFADPVTDGDTAWLQVDKGTRNKQDMPIRFADVHAPDKKDGPTRNLARAVAQKWFTDHAHSLVWPWEILLVKVKDLTHEEMTFERYIGHVWCSLDGQYMNTDLESYYRAQQWPMGN
jgi:hypothetical protein